MIIENVKLRHAVLHARMRAPSPEDRACRQTSPLYLCFTKTLQEQWKVAMVEQYLYKKHRKQKCFFKNYTLFGMDQKERHLTFVSATVLSYKIYIEQEIFCVH